MTSRSEATDAELTAEYSDSGTPSETWVNSPSESGDPASSDSSESECLLGAIRGEVTPAIVRARQRQAIGNSPGDLVNLPTRTKPHTVSGMSGLTEAATDEEIA